MESVINGNNLKIDPFSRVEKSEYSKIVQTLKERLPRSSNVYNMACILEKYPQEMSCFILHVNFISDQSIIMIIFDREDYGQDINISVPNDFEITPYIRNAFSSTKQIDWKGPHLFTSTDRKISLMIFEISTLVYRNSVIFNPNYSFWLNPEKALQLSPELQHGIAVKPLDEIEGHKFLLDNWKYSQPGGELYVKKIIKKHITAGVYHNGECVCGAVINGHGLVGILGTPKKHRKKGYAFTCMKYILREMALNGLSPASTCQQENFHSVNLHLKLGMEITHETDYIFHIPYIKTEQEET